MIKVKMRIEVRMDDSRLWAGWENAGIIKKNYYQIIKSRGKRKGHNPNEINNRQMLHQKIRQEA